MHLFGFIPPTNENKKKTEKVTFYAEFSSFFKLHILYFQKKKVLFKMPLILLKTVEKHVFYCFSEKKIIVAIFSVFCLLFDENNEISRKSTKN